MKKIILIVLIIVLIISVFIIYQVTHVKIGYMENRGGNVRLLSSESKNFDKVCSIDLNDSTEISIRVGTSESEKWLIRNYTINGDTIKVEGDISELKEYINTNKFLVRNGEIFVKLTPNKQYDTSYTSKIWLNKINLGN